LAFQEGSAKRNTRTDIIPSEVALVVQGSSRTKALWIDETLPSLKNQVEAELSNRSKRPTKTKRPL
jgi:hypothetical protein